MITDSEKLSIIAHVMNGELDRATSALFAIRQREEVAILPPLDESELSIARCNKIGAIKQFRTRTGATLYGAKAKVEQALAILGK